MSESKTKKWRSLTTFARLECGCVLVKYSQTGLYWIDSLCDKHRVEYYADPIKILSDLRRKVQ
jgi:hypothetical protein